MSLSIHCQLIKYSSSVVVTAHFHKYYGLIPMFRYWHCFGLFFFYEYSNGTKLLPQPLKKTYLIKIENKTYSEFQNAIENWKHRLLFQHNSIEHRASSIALHCIASYIIQINICIKLFTHDHNEYWMCWNRWKNWHSDE